MKIGRNTRLLPVLLVLALCASASHGQAASPGPAPAPSTSAPSTDLTPRAAAPTSSFRAEGPVYVAVATASGSTPGEAEEKARGAALRALFNGLGKDGLFAEVFIGSPPVGLSCKFDPAVKKVMGYDVTATIRVDDESIRILERGPYLSAAIGLLDKAEVMAAEAEAQAAAAVLAENGARLGEALSAYGTAEEKARAGLSLIEAIGDSSIFSSKSKRSAPELRRLLTTTRDSASAGLERMRKAEAALAADANLDAISEVVDRALAAASDARALLDETAPIVGDPGASSRERLEPLRDRLALGRRSLGDVRNALDRAASALPKGKTDRTYIADKVEYARRLLSTEDEALAAAYRVVDREIRDPSARRAARAQAFRWVFLHEPHEYLSFRAYLPFTLVTGQSGTSLGAAAMDFRGGMEGAFSLGRGGIWARTRVATSTLELSPGSGAATEFALDQSFDIGFWGRALFFAGYRWDWIRGVESVSSPKPGLVRIGLGGVTRDDENPKASWLLALSYEIPYELGEFKAWNVFNLGLETEFRLGSVAQLEGAIAHRLHRNPYLSEDSLDAVFSWSVGAAVRLPPPFLLGAEYAGSFVRPLKADGTVDAARASGGGRFRFYLGYSL